MNTSTVDLVANVSQLAIAPLSNSSWQQAQIINGTNSTIALNITGQNLTLAPYTATLFANPGMSPGINLLCGTNVSLSINWFYQGDVIPQSQPISVTDINANVAGAVDINAGTVDVQNVNGGTLFTTANQSNILSEVINWTTLSPSGGGSGTATYTASIPTNSHTLALFLQGLPSTSSSSANASLKITGNNSGFPYFYLNFPPNSVNNSPSIEYDNFTVRSNQSSGHDTLLAPLLSADTGIVVTVTANNVSGDSTIFFNTYGAAIPHQSSHYETLFSMPQPGNLYDIFQGKMNELMPSLFSGIRVADSVAPASQAIVYNNSDWATGPGSGGDLIFSASSSFPIIIRNISGNFTGGNLFTLYDSYTGWQKKITLDSQDTANADDLNLYTEGSLYGALALSGYAGNVYISYTPVYPN